MLCFIYLRPNNELGWKYILTTYKNCFNITYLLQKCLSMEPELRDYAPYIAERKKCVSKD